MMLYFLCFTFFWIQVSATIVLLKFFCPHTLFITRLQTLFPVFLFFPFFFQLILNWKVITGVWQLELLLKCPCVILNSWHLFCNLWLFYCISKKIMLSQSNCAIRFFFLLQSLELDTIGAWMFWPTSLQSMFREKKYWWLVSWALVINLSCLRDKFFKLVSKLGGQKI